MPGRIDQLLGLIGRAREPNIPTEIPGRLSDADLSRIQFAALQAGDRAKAERVAEVNRRRKQFGDGLPPVVQQELLKAPIRPPQHDRGLLDVPRELHDRLELLNDVLDQR